MVLHDKNDLNDPTPSPTEETKHQDNVMKQLSQISRAEIFKRDVDNLKRSNNYNYQY